MGDGVTSRVTIHERKKMYVHLGRLRNFTKRGQRNLKSRVYIQSKSTFRAFNHVITRDHAPVFKLIITISASTFRLACLQVAVIASSYNFNHLYYSRKQQVAGVCSLLKLKIIGIFLDA